ncbi:MAG: YibE/F family protein [Acidimicrobiia bacterium]
MATVVGLVALWPRGDAPDLSASTRGLTQVDATVTAVEIVGCTDPVEGLPTECQLVEVDVTSGPTAGEQASFLSSVVAFARWKGVRALAGLAVSFVVIIAFLLPSLLRDNNAVLVALVTTSVIAFAALYLAHGVSMATTVALLGTFGSVLLITLLAAIVTAAAKLSGLADESYQTLRVTAEAVDPRGILIAGIVIGALGVLDVTVTQVSAVAELRHADPGLSPPQLYRSAIRIGRDHVASTVNTLVLAYVGASLALLLLFLQEGRGIDQILGREIVAIEIVRTLVGSIGLILSVPLTTALAVLVRVDDTLHGHAHPDPPRPPTDATGSGPASGGGNGGA